LKTRQNLVLALAHRYNGTEMECTTVVREANRVPKVAMDIHCCYSDTKSVQINGSEM
jgi:hypothetical protein